VPNTMKPVPFIPFACTITLLTGTILLSALTERRLPEALALPLSEISVNIAGWNAAADNTLSAPTLRALDATSYLARTYSKDRSTLDFFVAFYSQQRAGESMHSPKHCLPGAGWEIWKHDSAVVPVDGQNVRINKYSIQNNGVRMLMLYWYQSKDRIVADEYMGKLLLARDTLLTGRTGGSIARLMLPDTPAAADEGMAFAAAVIPQLQRCFRGSAARE
jgi:EpsI family protein